MQKNIKSRVILKHDIEANWNLAKDSFRPLNGEIIIYDPDENHPYIRYKRGKVDPNNINQTLLLKDLEFETNMYIGADEPQDPPVGLLWLDTSDEIKLIKFYGDYDGVITEYIAEENMTLRQWVNSKYNTEGWHCMIEDGITGPEDPDAEDHNNGIGRQSEDGAILQFTHITLPENIEDIVDCDEPIIPDHTYYIISV